MKNTIILSGLLALILGCGRNDVKNTPLGITGTWTEVKELSDEFNFASVDTSIWDNDVNDWGVWSWEPENAYQQDGNLHVRMAYEPHQRNDEQLFYKSGIIRSLQPTTYGYFEARIKGCARFPGVCPAFWMKGDLNGESSEIDFMEIQEVEKDINQIDCNLHANILENGKKIWHRERRHWIAPWDPRDDFHVYGCENTSDSIHWYIDGQKILSARNEHFHLPMYVMLSMGVRTPLRYFAAPNPEHPEDQRAFANPETSTPDGFPTEMLVDWVRVWKRATN